LDVILREGIITSVPREQGKRTDYITKDWLGIGKKFDKILNSRFCLDRSISEKLYAICKDKQLMAEINSPKVLSRFSVAESLLKTGLSRGEMEASNIDYEFDLSKKMRGNKKIYNMGNTESSAEMIKYFLQKEGVTGAGPKMYFAQDNYTETEHSETNDKFSLIVCDGRIHTKSLQPQEDEISSREILLFQVLSSLRIIDVDGSILLKICHSHSRFTVGVIWVLSQLFETVTFSRPKLSSPLSSDRFIVCQKFRDVNASWATEHLQRAHEVLTKYAQDAEFDLLEIVLIPEMNEEFIIFMMSANDDLDKALLQALTVAKDTIDSDYSLVEDQQWTSEIIKTILTR